MTDYHDPEVARRFVDTLKNMNPSPEMQRSIERIEAELAGKPAPPPERSELTWKHWLGLAVALAAALVAWVAVWVVWM